MHPARRPSPPAPHPADAFGGAPSAQLLNPFRLHADPMARLVLINLDGDPDGLYEGFEPQAYDDDVHDTGPIVLGWRHDRRIDVFHRPGRRFDPATDSIAGDAVHVRLVPSDGWPPNETKWSLLLVDRVASVFRTWPSAYVWEAEIDVARSAHATLRSAWLRVR